MSSREYFQEDEAFFVSMFEKWLTISREVDKKIKVMEGSGYQVDYAERFRREIRNIHGALTPDREFFSGDGHEKLLGEAMQDHQEGRTSPFDVFGE
ncbi:MAG: hypothetical protein U0800_08575 [Isosphaeraceae bacterium]